MTVPKCIDVFEAYDRFSSGDFVPEETWDYEIIPKTAKMLRESYELDFGTKILPTDDKMVDRLFLAGMDMLITCGIYNNDLHRVMKIEEEEIYAGLKMAPKKLTMGSGKEKRKCKPRLGNAVQRPIIMGGPTGAPVSESVYEAMIESYVQEPLVDGIVSGVISGIHGRTATTNSPWEIMATMSEIRHVRQSAGMAGRPGMCI